MWAAHEAGVQHAWQYHVADEASAAGEQRPILKPRDARPEVLRAHGGKSPSAQVGPTI
jgi:hypothetical protein